MTPSDVARLRRRERTLSRRCDALWAATALGPAPDYGYASPADRDRETARQQAARELADVRARLAASGHAPRYTS